MFRRQSPAFFVFVCVFVAHPAFADPSAAEISAARHAFERAVSLENDQRWGAAVLELRAAIAVKDTPGLRFHLAHCETEQGHLVEAAAEYERARELLAAGASAPDVQQLLGPASAALKRRIPQLIVDFPSALVAPAASLDGRSYPISELVLGVPVNPGRHELRVSAAGRQSLERSVLLTEGNDVTVHAELAPSAPPTLAPVSFAPAAKSSNAPELRTVDMKHTSAKASPAELYVMIGEAVLTVAGLSVAIGYQFAKSSANDRITRVQASIDDAAHGDATACGGVDEASLNGACTDLLSAIDERNRDARLSSFGFVTAGVGAAALLTTWLVWPKAARSVSGFTVQPAAGLGRVGVLGRF